MPFDLEKSIATWRRPYEVNPIFSDEDIEELESSLRDRVEALIDERISEKKAFELATKRVGSFAAIKQEYKKVYWGKLKRNKKLGSEIIWRLMMLKNYLKITFRNVKRHPGYTAINIVGLGLGLGCFYLIMLFIQHELNYDRFHTKADDIVRLIYSSEQNNNAGEWKANSAAGFGPLLSANIPEIESVVRTDDFGNPYVTLPSGDKRRLPGLLLADSSFFSVFDFTLQRGQAASVLKDTYALVLSESTAKAFFGDEDPIGKSMSYGGHFDLTVTGVMEDVSSQSHLQFGAVAPFELLNMFQGGNETESFTNYNYNTYLLLTQGADRENVENKITKVVRERFDESNAPDDESSKYLAGLQPLADIHTTTDLRFDIGGHRNIRYLFTFGAIGVLILLIACVNFMNLATARASQRAAEVGVRKAIGAQRSQLVGQFISESLLLGVASMVIGLLVAALALPFFNQVVGGAASFSLKHLDTVLMLIVAGLIAGVLAGSYPAFYLSAFRPAYVLKGIMPQQGGAARIRKGLIVFQFAASIFLTVATLTVYHQLNYMQDRDLGFSKEQVVFLSPTSTIYSDYDVFRQNLLASPYVQNVAFGGGLPGRVGTNRGYNWPGNLVDGKQQGSDFWSVFADPDYFDVLGIELLAGRTFMRAHSADVDDAYILNETAIKQLGWTPEEAIGQQFRAWDRPMGQVVGVVKDFHFQSLHQEVEALVFNYKPAWMNTIAIRTSSGSFQSALQHLEGIWPNFSDNTPLEYRFLDEDFARQYENESRLGTLFAFFASIAVFIACLGLFGLAAFVVQQRTKEIGVRKVLGASSKSLIFLLSKDFLALVLFALLLAAPAAYFAMNRWLESFAFRIGMEVEVFLLAGVLAIGIAFLTVSTHAIRMTRLNPVDSLRNA